DSAWESPIAHSSFTEVACAALSRARLHAQGNAETTANDPHSVAPNGEFDASSLHGKIARKEHCTRVELTEDSYAGKDLTTATRPNSSISPKAALQTSIAAVSNCPSSLLPPRA